QAPGGRWVDDDDGERKWRSAALQGCPKALRKKLAHKNYIDVDMVGAAPSLLLTVARECGLGDKVPTLKELARDVKAARRTICETSESTMDEAKRTLNMVIHGSPKRRGESAFLTSLREESLMIAEVLWEDPKWKALMSRVWQTLEHTALMMVWKQIRDDRRVVFIFDGMLVPRCIVEDETLLIRRFEEATRELCPELKWAVKEWARRGVKSDLFCEYNYGDIRVIDNFLNDPETNNIFPYLRIEANERRLHIYAESADECTEDQLIATCPTPTMLTYLMELQSRKGKRSK
ncbi:hypothetical protein T492DRAFT_1135073, partial [Pavlovales sp. CCMP2436]